MFKSFLKGLYEMNDVIKDTNLSFSNLMSYQFNQLILIFSNLNRSDKKEAIDLIHDFENNINYEIIIFNTVIL